MAKQPENIDISISKRENGRYDIEWVGIKDSNLGYKEFVDRVAKSPNAPGARYRIVKSIGLEPKLRYALDTIVAMKNKIIAGREMLDDHFFT